MLFRSVLRDLFKRGKYPDVILPMCVLRRMDAVLEPTKQAVLDTKQMLDDAHITEQRAALANAAGQAFYNTSRFTLRDLKSRGNTQSGSRRPRPTGSPNDSPACQTTMSRTCRFPAERISRECCPSPRRAVDASIHR